jgi:hypothetical protein
MLGSHRSARTVLTWDRKLILVSVTMFPPHRLALGGLVSFALSACATPELAPRPPEFAPKDQATCRVKKSQTKPLVVEWPAAERVDLEAGMSNGVIVVRYDGCEMELLTQCRADGAYEFQSVTPKSDTLVITNEDDLHAAIPMGAARFEAKLSATGQLNVAMTMVGRWHLPAAGVTRSGLSGRCDQATHVLTGLTVGAFEFYAGAGRTVEAGVESLLGAGLSGETSSANETIMRDGDATACVQRASAKPPEGCRALLRIEATPIIDDGPSRAHGPRDASMAFLPRPWGWRALPITYGDAISRANAVVATQVQTASVALEQQIRSLSGDLGVEGDFPMGDPKDTRGNKQFWEYKATHGGRDGWAVIAAINLDGRRVLALGFAEDGDTESTKAIMQALERISIR